MDFVKYQSLENDFIIIDYYKSAIEHVEKDVWEKQTPRLCNRHTGIGGDGIMCITHNKNINLPELTLFNCDGTQAELCLNGLRCAAHYLYKYLKFPASFLVMMNNTSYSCEIKTINNTLYISTFVPKPQYEKKISIPTSLKTWEGHCINAGNPHCVIFDTINDEDLLRVGKEIESHHLFPHKTNVEFIVRDKTHTTSPKRFTMKIFERGCGITRACSSGAAAALKALLEEGHIAPGEAVEIEMPGGTLECSIDTEKEIIITAPAFHVFSGVIDE